MQRTKCTYCGSTNYGRGCPYAPNKIHIHIGNGNRCVYCGSTNYGKGCPFSENGLHVHGIEYNSMLKDSVWNMFTTQYLVEALTKPITEMKAFKLGLINEKGDIIREQTTFEEKQALGRHDLYVLRLRKLLGDKINLLNTSLSLENSIKENRELDGESYANHYKKVMEFRQRYDKVMSILFNMITEATENGLSIQEIENSINFVKRNEDW